MILGEKKLFYNSEGVLLYDMTSSKIELVKKKKLELNNEVNLKEILEKKDFIPISGMDIKSTIKYIEYDINKNVYNVYFELSFFDARVSVTQTSDQTLVMGIYDENFNYMEIKEYPTYKFEWGVEIIKRNSDIRMKIQPVIMNKDKTFVFGIGFQEDVKGETIYKYDLETNKSETIKYFDNIVFLKTLIGNDRKLIYLTINSFKSIEESKNDGEQVFVLDLKNMKTTEIKLSNDLFKEFYYSHEIRNTNEELIEKFYKLK